MSRKNIKWNLNPDFDNRRIELLKEGYSYRAIAEVMTNEFNVEFSQKAIENRSYYTRTTKQEIGIEQLESKFDIKVEKETLFPKDSYEVNEDLLFTTEKKRRLDEIYCQFNNGRSKKILSLSDLHAPFIDFNAVEKAVLEHQDADILVLNGDVFDGQALSDFDKLNDFDIEVEFEQVFILLDVVTKMFEQVIWVGGNHDMSRFIRMVSRKFGQGMKKYVLKRLNPIEYIAEKYDNVLVVPHQWVQIGKAIFIHPDGYSSALMSTAMGQEKILRANIDMLPNPEFQCLVQGHTHDLGSYYINGTKIIEQGHLGVIPDYRWDKPTVRRWQQGYAIVHLDDNGNVDFNKTREYIIN